MQGHLYYTRYYGYNNKNKNIHGILRHVICVHLKMDYALVIKTGKYNFLHKISTFFNIRKALSRYAFCSLRYTKYYQVHKLLPLYIYIAQLITIRLKTLE